MRDFSELQHEALSIRTDIQTAYKLIKDTKARYIKSKLRVRSKKQTEVTELIFNDLEPYASLQEIQESYGYAEFSLTEYERLIGLWNQREEFNKTGKVYNDRVTEMLDKAAARLIDPYQDLLDEYDELNRKNERNQQGKLF